MRAMWMAVPLLLIVTACGAQPVASPTPSVSAANAFSQCMRANGVTDFPDPDANGTIDPSALKSGDPAYDKAFAACKSLLPAGRGNPGKLDEATLNQWRAYAQCMRDNGLPNFPDPQPDGPLFGDGQIDRNDPAFQKATKTCQSKRPTTGGGQ